ncbi:MAG: hypothetical protein KA314_08325 [Chloroflexi bacterium]|nr:hypothetical protein [Chloroflexota bacterium]MBP8055834.1 hypothetical protein [Chloroflexota bacterium]
MFRFNIIGMNMTGICVIIAAITRIFIGDEVMTAMEALRLCGVLMLVTDVIYRLRSQENGGKGRWLALRTGGWFILPVWGAGILFALLGWLR